MKKIIIGSLALLVCNVINKFPNLPMLACEERSRRNAVRLARIKQRMDATANHPQRVIASRVVRNVDGTVKSITDYVISP
jgi:predicted nucleic acid-binding OB-fold protein